MIDPAHVHEAAADGGGFMTDLLKVYIPREHCMFYETELVWLHAVSDLLIALAYYSIPLALFVLLRRRRDLVFPWVFWLFALFIFACGTTHLFSLLAIWHPVYRIDGMVKGLTAGVSVLTAALLWPSLPRMLTLPSANQLRELNEELRQEIDDRTRVEEELRQLQQELEERVEERTHEIQRTNTALEREIEARKEAEAERSQLLHSERAARAQAERLNRVKDEFLANVTHELRTPLNAMSGWIHLLESRGDDDPKLRRGLEVLARNVKAQDRLISDLLDVSRIVAGTMRLQVGEVDLESVLHLAIESLQPAIDAKQIDLRLELESTPLISGDADRLRQVMWNLLSNAVRFTPDQGQIHVALERTERGLAITMRDTGPGVPHHFLPHLFERFRQAETPGNRKTGGLGIGLGIVKSLVELHGGMVSARNLDRGSEFRVELPLRADAVPDLGGVGAPGSKNRLTGLDILIVEDDVESREAVALLLEERGATIRSVSDAEEAAAAFGEHRPDVLISDLGLPDRDGVALLRDLGNEFGALPPAIAITAYDRTRDRLRAREAGFTHYLTKPLDFVRLLSILLEVAREDETTDAPETGTETGTEKGTEKGTEPT